MEEIFSQERKYPLTIFSYEKPFLENGKNKLLINSPVIERFRVKK